MEAFSLVSKTAVVTGGNGGIGLGIAKALAEAGARIVLLGRSTEKNAAAKQELVALGGEAITYAGDVCDENACAEVMDAAVSEFGSLDILVNNAGMTVRKRPEELTLSEWREVVDTNLTSTFTCSKAAYKHMCAGSGGKILNIGSMMAIFGSPLTAAYAASKGGVVQLTKALASAWAQENIQVNVILPGWIDTEPTRGSRKSWPSLEQKVTARTPAGRWGTPEDHGGAAVFLCSRASDFVTGTVLPVDGGYSIEGWPSLADK